MNIINSITSGASSDGIRVVIAGSEKIGKTTLACDAPNPLLVPIEIGYSQFTIPKVKPIESYQELLQLVGEITELARYGNFPYKTIIFDSATKMEALIHQHILESDAAYGRGAGKAITMGTALGGYGSAYSLANELFSRFLGSCDLLAVKAKVNIIFTCHIFAAKLIDPIHGEYDSWDLQLYSPKNQKTFGTREIITQWADIVGFLYEPMYISEGETVTKGISANKGRVLGVSRTPSYVAGNRFGMQGEIPIPPANGWNQLANAVYQSSNINIFKQ